MHSLRLSPLCALLVLGPASMAWSGCAEPAPASAPATPEAAPTDEAKPEAKAEPASDDTTKKKLDDGTVEQAGTLEYTPLPQTKSVAAYMGVEFTLHHTHDGGETVLEVSEAIPHETLEAAAGKKVRVTCTPQEATPPDPREAAPIGPDGAPLARPEKCVVQHLEVLTTP